MEYTNPARVCQIAATGQCSSNMNCTLEPDDQGVKIIPGGLTYWQDLENEVQYNSGRSNAREISPQLPNEASNQLPGQLSIAEQENDCSSSSVEHNDKYAEDDCRNPLTENKEICVPLDLTVESREQSGPPDTSISTPEGQTGHKDKSHLPTEEYFKSEIEKIKEQVIQDLMIFTEKKEWMCKKCKLVFGSPLRVRQHILSRHFEGPLTRCKYCGVY